MGWQTFASLVLTELYVPRWSFVEFMESAKTQLMSSGANVVYGTVRLIEPENETALPWAKEDYACVIFNLLVEHSSSELDRSKGHFRALIDCASTLTTPATDTVALPGAHRLRPGPGWLLLPHVPSLGEEGPA